VPARSNDAQPHPDAFAAQKGGAVDNYAHVVGEQPRASNDVYLSLSAVLFIPPGDRLEFDCRAEDGDTMYLAYPATLYARRIHVVEGPAAINLPVPMLQGAVTH